MPETPPDRETPVRGSAWRFRWLLLIVVWAAWWIKSVGAIRWFSAARRG